MWAKVLAFLAAAFGVFVGRSKDTSDALAEELGATKQKLRQAEANGEAVHDARVAADAVVADPARLRDPSPDSRT